MKKILVSVLLFPFFLSNAQTITTFAGTGLASGSVGDGGAATSAVLNAANGGAFDRHGNYYVTEILGHRVRKITPGGVITTVAGTGISGYSGDNIQATAAKLNDPATVLVDSNDNLYINDNNNHRIRRVDGATGIITTIAGTGVSGYNGDNIPATTAQLMGIEDICFDKYGNLYLSDYPSNRVRKINTAGIITTIAGFGGFSSTGTGDGGPATAATFNYIAGLVVDDTGNIFVADWNGAKIRIIDTSGIINTIAGNGVNTYIGDEIPAVTAQFNPLRLTFDNAKNLVIGDKYNHRILKIDNAGIIHSIAGNGSTGFSGDSGPATAASLDFPAGIVFDDCDNLYIAESNNRRVRRVAYSANPIITITGSSSVALGSTVTVTATVTNAGSGYSINWYNKGVLFSTTTVPGTTYIKTAGTDSITATIYGCGSSAPSGLHVVAIDNHTGINSIQKGIGNMVLFPNPVTASLHISNAQPGGSYTLYEMTGRAVTSGMLDKQDNEIDMGRIPHGVYLLQVVGSDGVRDVRKVVKE